MARPRTKKILLTDEQVKTVNKTLRSSKVCGTVKNRCRVLLDLDMNHGKTYTDDQIARRNGVSKSTVRSVVSSFANGKLDSVLTIKRSINSDNAKRKVDGRAEARLVELACGPVPEGHDRWTLRLLEDKCKMVLEEPVGKDAIARALKKTKLDLTKASTGAFRQKKTRNS